MEEITRRTMIQGAAATAVAGAVAPSALAKKTIPAAARGRRVAVLGGGMAGLAAAHELSERGFSVDVYERNALGGKARSIPVPRTANGGRRALPGEHGFRFFPGFYHHVPDTMRRIPFGKNPDGVWNNLVDAMETVSPRTEGRPDATLFGMVPNPGEAQTPEGMRRLLLEAFGGHGVPPHELAFFVDRVMVFLTSCDERRYGEWEHISWWDYLQAEGKSEEYKTVLARGLTRALVAAKETMASTRTIGNMAEAFVFCILQQGNDGAPDRVLDLPTNEAWINPWVKLLKRQGVRFHVGQKVEALNVKNGRVVSARAADRRGRRRRIEADWFFCAMPAERARKLWSPAVLAADPSLKAMDELHVDWMNGIQYYLSKPVDFIRGHVTFVDAPWALTALTQGQFWEDRDFKRDYGDGSVVDCLSVDISDWDTPGLVNNKPAKQCTAEEVAKEVFEQMKAHLNDNGTEVLPDDAVHSWFLDPGIRWRPARGRNTNDEPLLVNTVGSWEKRPAPQTKIGNLYLAGDYVQNDIDLATMEGANESARAAVNAFLDATDSKAERVQMFKLHDPPAFEPAKAVDRELFKAGLPNALYVP